MKHNSVWCLVLWLIGGIPIPSQAQQATVPKQAYQVAERGPHHRVWRTAGGAAAYTELATGLHYFEADQWKETREEIEILNGAAVARQGPHKARFAANLNSSGAIELTGADGQRFRSHLLGLAYTDATTGHSVLIAMVKDCRGAILPPNQVIYEDAFSGDCHGDVRYTYTRRGFEQDIILLEAPPSPTEWGMDPETTRLEVFTEFIELPAHRRTEVVLRGEANRLQAAQMAEPDLIDQHLDFGAMHFGPGLAFPLDEPLPFSSRAVPTGKSLELIEGRVFLVEKTDYRSLRPLLARLPQTAAAVGPRPDPAKTRSALVQLQTLQAPPTAGVADRWENLQFAQAFSARPVRPGVVLDYLAVNASLTNWHFRNDTTYLVSDVVDLRGATVLENAVIKFAPGGSLHLWGELECRTSTYRPAIFTARDDHSVGMPLGAWDGTPRGLYAIHAVALRGAGRRYALQNLSVRYAGTAISADEQVDLDLSHVQVTRSRVGLEWRTGADVTCRNFLFADLDTAFQGALGSPSIRGEHGTLHRIDQLISDTTGGCLLTNCLLVSVTNNVQFAGSHVVAQLGDAGVFKVAGGGGHYLPEASPYRNAGTVAINPVLRANLRELTTAAPLLITRDFTRDVILRPHVLRDTDRLDLGYHYPAVDYCWGGLKVSHARLTLLDGVTVGLKTVGVSSGLTLDVGGELVVRGQPHRLTRFVQPSTLQEKQVPARFTSKFAPAIVVASASPPAAEPRLLWRFAESILSGGAGAHLVGHGPLYQRSWEFRDCQFSGGRIFAGEVGLAVTNCIFDRVYLEVASSDNAPPRHLQQNFFREGTVQIELPTSTQVHARNNFFERTTLRVSGTWHHSHNGYVVGADRLPGSGPTDRVLTQVRFQAGPLGWFYYPTGGGAGTLATLLDAGSASAADLGLAHYTSRADQTAEGLSPIDIGFHYVSIDTATGRPRDWDRDGQADYFEDTDGNALVDSGESDWLVYDSAHQLAGAARLQVFTPLK